MELAELLADIDPVGLVRIGAPRDEYESEALDLVRGRQPVDGARVREVFIAWFGDDSGQLTDQDAEAIALATSSLDLPPTHPRLWAVQKQLWLFWTGLKLFKRNAPYRIRKWRKARRAKRNP